MPNKVDGVVVGQVPAEEACLLAEGQLLHVEVLLQAGAVHGGHVVGCEIVLVHALLGAEAAVQFDKVVAVLREGVVGVAIEAGGLHLGDLVRDHVLKANVQIVALGVHDLQQLEAVTTAALLVAGALGLRGDHHEHQGAELFLFLPDHLRVDLVLLGELRGQPLGECLKLGGRRRRCRGPRRLIGAEDAFEESVPADVAGGRAAAGRATAAGVAATSDFEPRWGSFQACW